MNTVDFSAMTTPQLVAFYNRHAKVAVRRFSDRKTALSRCADLYKSLAMPTASQIRQRSEVSRPSMKVSLSLDRRITCVQTGEVWKNAYQMWVEHNDWMTGGQQDRLTAVLYSAAKRGERAQLTINGRTFQLVHVQTLIPE